MDHPLDWILVVFTALLLAFLGIILPTAVLPVFARMFGDFGVELPPLTAIVLLRWLPPLVALVPTALLVAAVVAQRRILAAAAFVVAALAIGVYLVGLYLPIFQLAGNIKGV